MRKGPTGCQRYIRCISSKICQMPPIHPVSRKPLLIPFLYFLRDRTSPDRTSPRPICGCTWRSTLQGPNVTSHVCSIHQYINGWHALYLYNMHHLHIYTSARLHVWSREKREKLDSWDVQCEIWCVQTSRIVRSVEPVVQLGVYGAQLAIRLPRA